MSLESLVAVVRNLSRAEREKFIAILVRGEAKPKG
jgi:hypothetical protein